MTVVHREDSGFWLKSGDRYHKIGAYVVEYRLGKWMVCMRDTYMRLHPIQAFDDEEAALRSVNDGEVKPLKVAPAVVPSEALMIVSLASALAVAGGFLFFGPEASLSALISALVTSGVWYLFTNPKEADHV